MDRLISENLILSLFDGKVEQEAPIFSKTMTKIIKGLPSAYKGMTNGEVLCTMFPSLHYTLSDNGRIVTTIGVASSFDKEWWDSPYSEEGSD